MWCLSFPARSIQDPIFDLEKVILDTAWREFLEEEAPACCCMRREACARKHFELVVDWSKIQRTDTIINYGQTSGEVRPPKKITVFGTEFHNSLDKGEKQKFVFSCTKQVSSTNELSVTEGFTIGGSLNLATTVSGAKVGLPMDSTGGVTINASWTGTKGQRLVDADTMTWNLNSEVSLDPGQSASVSAHLQEAEVDCNISIESRIRAVSTHEKICIDVKQRRSQELYTIIELPVKALLSHLAAKGRIQTDSSKAGEFTIITTALLKMTCAVNQEVIVTPSQPA